MRDPLGLTGRVLDERFEVRAPAARGGSGVVYRAWDRHTGADVAVKVLHLADRLTRAERARVVLRFRAEVATLARLTHPAVVRVLGSGATPEDGRSTPWMALEWIDGETLAAHLAHNDAYTPAACLALLRPVFEALAEAHAAGIAHRDLKPSNLMLQRRGGEVVARVLDFGFAREVEPGTAAGTGVTRSQGDIIAFSLRYAAFEQVQGARTGPWTDVHALGLVLTEMLVGRAPYRGETEAEVLPQVLDPARPTPAAFGVDVGAWEPVLARCLALRPDARFADAGELLAALETALPDACRRAPAPPPRAVDDDPPDAPRPRLPDDRTTLHLPSARAPSWRLRWSVGVLLVAVVVALVGLWVLRRA